MSLSKEFVNIISQRIKLLRKIKKYKQKDAAEILGISSSAYSLYETGKREMGLESIVKLAEYYGVSTDYILGRIETSERAKDAVSPKELDLIKKYRMLDSSVQDAICGFIDASYAAVVEKEKENRA